MSQDPIIHAKKNNQGRCSSPGETYRGECRNHGRTVAVGSLWNRLNPLAETETVDCDYRIPRSKLGEIYEGHCYQYLKWECPVCGAVNRDLWKQYRRSRTSGFSSSTQIFSGGTFDTNHGFASGGFNVNGSANTSGTGFA